ncbi:hypothetical protein HS088_TW04G01630 [Tripterygium wilfordii]|uniref:Amino-acid racemase n=1 Tax=Tripterygium wilfordii TaxID=458696 RepID=A0A7J7DTL3_TRIWF|nr:broad specificity amino-acid racemase RacX-like [Tripterygium wilfordii]XP_038699260.1 broad specificity amino-acid racemase RacX-like [Tripterygium wilfordii]KAF5749657.1 hypothetical protein HS088_TW04G01630 [Tripterygium wilfordii]
MLDGGMTVSFHALNCPPAVLGNANRKMSPYRRRPNPPGAVHISSVLVQTDESDNFSKSKKNLGSVRSLKRCQAPFSPLKQANTVGIIGGVSVWSTLVFLEKLVWWSSRDDKESLPFTVCSDPVLHKEISPHSHSSFQFLNGKAALVGLNHGLIVENLLHKRRFLEQSGARCIVMPCHISHAWHGKVSEGCSVPFFHVGDCVARELKEAKLKPLEAGSDVRIGLLAADATLAAGFYQEKLQSQGFEVVLPDKGTMEHILNPAIEAKNRRDMEGARNLLRIAVQVLLVRAVNTVIICSDEMQGLLPLDDPLLKKCIDPMDSLARSTIEWAKSTGKVQKEQ